ncbi:MAG: phosphotransferase [Mariprofundaceae bacterium]|nr:phosphotransferase [Mariprofundaceae bacterium]
MTDVRLKQATQWLHDVLDVRFDVRTLAGDASFRRYFRVHAENVTWVLMDAPPEKEDCSPFLRIRAWFQHAQLRVPNLIAEDQLRGFLLLEDFGDDTWAAYLQKGKQENVQKGGDAKPLFQDALRQLHILQAAQPSFELPNFDVLRMQRECDLYLDWYLPKVVDYLPSKSERRSFHAALLPYLQRLQALPKSAVHLDYHSRNLMLPKGGLPLGIIDFQDAVLGPITYDLASLLYDCYQDYPESLRREWSEYFFSALPTVSKAYFIDFNDWHETLRLTAFQRHVKAIGIFSRLAYRDGKQNFLNEIPLTKKHLQDGMAILNLPDVVVQLLQKNLMHLSS